MPPKPAVVAAHFQLKPFVPFLALFAVYIVGWGVEVMEVDAAQYASMSMEMLEKDSYLQIYQRGEDYLDKPPLIFWLSCLSYVLFGISTASYKLPSFLFSLLAIYSTYRFGRLFYEQRTAYLAALILGSTQAFFLLNNDCRTDTLLSGSVIFGIWQIAAYLKNERWHHLALGSVGICLAMLAKGPIGLMIPALAFGAHFVITRQWKNFIRPQWLIALLIIGVGLAPMFYGLYRQYGMHGIHFYVWLQSFGRITGASEWDNDGGFSFFFTHTTLWSFLPWSLLLIGAFVALISALIRKKPLFLQEYIALGGFVLGFIAFSFSKFKLPHYIYVLFPLAAVLAAAWTEKIIHSRLSSRLSRIHLVLALLIWAGIIILSTWFFPLDSFLFGSVLIALFAGMMVLFFRKEPIFKLFGPAFISILAANLVMNSHVYPKLLTFQAPTTIGKYLKAESIPLDKVYNFKSWDHSLYFALKQSIPNINVRKMREKIRNDEAFWVHVNPEGYRILKKADVVASEEVTFDNFHVTKLSLKFLDPATRAETLDKHYLLSFP